MHLNDKLHLSSNAVSQPNVTLWAGLSQGLALLTGVAGRTCRQARCTVNTEDSYHSNHSLPIPLHLHPPVAQHGPQ